MYLSRHEVTRYWCLYTKNRSWGSEFGKAAETDRRVVGRPGGDDAVRLAERRHGDQLRTIRCIRSTLVFYSVQ